MGKGVAAGPRLFCECCMPPVNHSPDLSLFVVL